jgi:hypothetical protein
MVNHKLSDGRPDGNVAGGLSLEGFVVEVRNYQDGTGRAIQERVPVLGDAPPDFHRFIGVGKVTLQIQTPAGPQVATDTFRFPIEGVTTIGDAFRLYEPFRTRHEAVYKQRIEQQLAAANQPQIAVAPASALDNLPVPRPRG